MTALTETDLTVLACAGIRINWSVAV